MTSRAVGAVLAALLAAAVPVLAGCSGTVSVTPGPDAADPACADVLRAAPDEIAGQARRETTAQSALAWGDPAVVLRCGVRLLGPASNCLGVETGGTAVDWVVVQDEDALRYTTYGRDPATEVAVPASLAESDRSLATLVLSEVAAAAGAVEASATCSQ